MTTHNDNPNTMFWLARYAHHKLAPIFADAKALEPSLQFHIEMTFADDFSVFSKDSHLNISSHWARDGMFQQSIHLRSKEDVDWFAAKVAEDVAALTVQVAV